MSMKRILEVQTPFTLEVDEFVSGLGQHEDFDAFLIDESGGMDAVVVAARVREALGRDAYLKVHCRDRNRIALHSQLITAADADLLDIVLVDGIHPSKTPFPDARAVYDIDALGLLRMIKLGEPAPGLGIDSAIASAPWRAAVFVGGSTAADMARARKFLEAGADMFFSGSIECIAKLREMTDVPIIRSVPGEPNMNLTEIIKEAEDAGASGVNLACAPAGVSPDGSLA